MNDSLSAGRASVSTVPDIQVLLSAMAIETLSIRETYRDHYWRERDPINDDRLLWRAQTFRHMVHLLPGQSILELGSGSCRFTRKLLHVSRGRNPITAATFQDGNNQRPENLPAQIEFLDVGALQEGLAGRQFDFIVVHDLLDRRIALELLQFIHQSLAPGGQVLLYESNPWNPVLRIRRLLLRNFGRQDPRRLLSKPDLYELLSDVGFIRVFAVFNDFVYAPISRPLIWLLRNLSILLENAPGVRMFAGSILLHAQKPPIDISRPGVSLCEHRKFLNAVSVVIPCHNEEMNIAPMIQQLLTLYDDYIREIIVVDDGSLDGTATVVRELAAGNPAIKPIFRLPPNGVGRALAEGYAAASAPYLLSLDCDFQHLLPELRDLFAAAAEGYDVVAGSRFSRHSVLLNYPFRKILANRGFHALASLLLRRRFRDLTNNLKLMRRSVVEQLKITEPGFAANAEIGMQPLMMGFSVKEVPISWVGRRSDMGISSFRLMKAGGGYLRVLARLWSMKSDRE